MSDYQISNHIFETIYCTTLDFTISKTNMRHQENSFTSMLYYQLI